MPTPSRCHDTDTDPCKRLAAKLFVARDRLLAFDNYEEFLTELIASFSGGKPPLLIAGHPDLSVTRAASRSGLTPTEIVGTNPFAVDTARIVRCALTGREIIWIANPNPISGAAVGLNDLRRLAQAVPEGALIVDERYFEFYRITALSLIEEFPRIITLRCRSLLPSDFRAASGFAVAGPVRVAAMSNRKGWKRLAVMPDEISGGSELDSHRIRVVHEQSMKIANSLQQHGLRPRLSATDQVLIPVTKPQMVQDYLAELDIAVDNLNIHAGLTGYVRYRVQSASTNDRLLRALRQMPEELLVAERATGRRLRFRRPAGQYRTGSLRLADPTPVRGTEVLTEVRYAGGV